MTVSAAKAATAHAMKLVKLSLSFFCRNFNASKCKTAAKMAVARIKLLRNKREATVRQMRRDIALLLQSKQDATARIRVEHVIREQNILAANEFIELFCELIVARLSIIAKQRECPADLKEGIASVIFASLRCSEIPELEAVRDIFAKKYGKDFVSAATDLRPNSGVNRMLIEKLSVRTPSGEVKLKVMKEIAKEHHIDWDTTELEMELLKPPEERIEGPNSFVSATSLPMKHVPALTVEPKRSNARSVSNRERGGAIQFDDTVSAAEAASKSANQAIAAAQAAAYLGNKDSKQFTQASGFEEIPNPSKSNRWSEGSHYISCEEDRSTHIEGAKVHRRNCYNAPPANSGIKFDESDYDEANKMEESPGGKVYRRHSYNAPSAHPDIKWDESDCDDRTYLPPEQRPPPVPSSLGNWDSVHHVHPKLPDYDDLAAHFDALKYRKS